MTEDLSWTINNTAVVKQSQTQLHFTWTLKETNLQKAAGVLLLLLHPEYADVLYPCGVTQLLSQESSSEGHQYHPEDHWLLNAIFRGLIQLWQPQ